MKKTVLFLFLTMMLGMFTNVFADTITIGSGTTTTAYLPIDTYFGYSYSQQIYTQAQINTAGNIEKIRFYYSSGPTTNSNAWVIYMGHTAKTTFSSTTDWVPSASLTQVFNGNVTFPGAAGWMEITLSTPFSYNNTSNLVVAVDENTASYASSAAYWRTFASGTYTGIYYYSDSTNPNPASPPTASGRLSSINQVQFDFAAAGGVANPTNFTSTPASNSQINLTWALNANSNNVLVAYNTTNTFGTPVNGSTYSSGNTLPSGGGTVLYAGSNVSYNQNGLSPATTYYYKAWSYDGTTTYSAGTSTSSTTYYAVPYTQNFNASTTLPADWGGDFIVSTTTSHGTSSSNGLYRNLYSSVPTANVQTPVFGSIPSDSEIMFDYRIVNFTGYPGTATTLGASDKIEVQASTNGGTSYTTIYTINSTTHTTSAAFATKNISLPAGTIPAGSNVKIKFLATWGAGDYYVDFDNFVIREIPQTPIFSISPDTKNFGTVVINTSSTQVFTISNTGSTNLVINAGDITFAGGSSSYFTFDPAPTPMNLANGQSGTFTVKYLPTVASVTPYTATVNIIHNAPGTPTTVSLSGSCLDPTINTLPYTQNFDSVTTPALPADWSKLVVTSTSANVTTSSTNHSVPNGAAIANSDDATASVYLIAPPLANSIDVTLTKVKFWAYGYTYPVKVGIMSNPTDGSTFSEITTISATSTWTQYSVSFASYAGAGKFVAFKHGLGGTYRTIYIDDVEISQMENMSYTSSTTTQTVTSSIYASSTSQQIIGLQVVAANNLNPLTVTEFQLNTGSSTLASDIANAKVWSTGTSSVFATTEQFGTTVNTPSGAFNVTGSKTLSEGTNYFWLTYDIAANPIVGDDIDAECTGIVVGGTTRTPTVSAPAGTRKVAGKKISSISVTQVATSNVSTGSTDQQVLQILFSVTETTTPGDGYANLSLNSMQVSSSNTSNADITTTKLFRSNTSTYVTTNQLGSSVPYSGGVASFNALSYNLPVGSTYVWFANDISATATPNNLVDAQILANTINVAGILYPAVAQNPTGSRTIVNYSYGGGLVANGGYYFANSSALTAPSKPTYNWVDISATGTDVYSDLSGDDGYAPKSPNAAVGYDIGFSFPYFGTNYTKFWVGADGNIFFSQPSSTPYTNTTLPGSAAPNTFISVFWDDLNPTSTQTPAYPTPHIYYKNVDGNLVITFDHLEKYSSSAYSVDNFVWCQVILYPSGKIKYQYNGFGGTSLSSVSIGIENSDGTKGIQYLYDGTGGPLTGTGNLALAFGLNAHMLGDDAVEVQTDAPQIVAVNSTLPVSFGNTGSTVQFTTNTVTTNLTSIRVDAAPGGSLPSGILHIASRYWTINSTATAGLGEYDLTLNLQGIGGITDMSTIHLLKRSSISGTWADMGVPALFNNLLRTATWHIANGFSEFSIGGGEDNTLPVELSSFTVALTNDMFVNLKWVVQSETNHMGYNVRRSNDNELNNSILVNNGIITDGISVGTQITYQFVDQETESDTNYYYWLESISLNNEVEYYGPVMVTIGQPGDDDPIPVVPVVTALLDAYPNPFNPSTALGYVLKDAGDVKMDVYNVRGQLIRTFSANHTESGQFRFVWDGKDLNGREVSSGVYFYRMTSGKYSASKKMIMMK